MYSVVKKILFSIDPETAHHFVEKTSSLFPKALLHRLTQVRSPCLKTSLGGIHFANPVGLAAGFDKDGDIIDFMTSLGFGFLEIGSITAEPCLGNPKPRLFRLLRDESLINRMGLPNRGADAVARHLAAKKISIPVGINLAKTPGGNRRSGVEDYLYSFSKLRSYADYIVLNLSCPNTEDGRTFEDPGFFSELATAFQRERRNVHCTQPVLLKISPDTPDSQLRRLIDSALDCEFDGFVVSNTTTTREGLKTNPGTLEKIGSGGLSGRALRFKSNERLKKVYEQAGSGKIIMGVGGILCFEDLLEKMSLGAGYFQIYTGLIYRGPFFIRELNRKLTAFCAKMGVGNYRELVGQRF